MSSINFGINQTARSSGFATFCTAARLFVQERLFGQSPFDPKMFKEFWEKSAREFEDLGEFIRESIDEWLRHKKQTARQEGQTTERDQQ